MRKQTTKIGFGDTLTGDWIEFYNNTSEDLDVSGWKIIASNGKKFVFPNTTINHKDYLVIGNNIAKFKQAFPECNHFIGRIDFGIGDTREVIMLYDQNDNPVDSIGYNFSNDTLRNVHTIVLKDFNLNNNNIEDWRKQQRSGSPASVNPDYVKIRKKQEWDRFINLVKIGGVTTAIFVVIVMTYISLRKKMQKVD